VITFVDATMYPTQHNNKGKNIYTAVMDVGIPLAPGASNSL
jgi:hypothetical protein